MKNYNHINIYVCFDIQLHKKVAVRKKNKYPKDANSLFMILCSKGISICACTNCKYPVKIERKWVLQIVVFIFLLLTSFYSPMVLDFFYVCLSYHDRKSPRLFFNRFFPNRYNFT